ncbi:MAG: cytochrome c biogenesis protein ResB [Methylocystaceae bacterium]
MKTLSGLQNPFTSGGFYLLVLMLGINLFFCLGGRFRRLIRIHNRVCLGSFILHLGLVLIMVGAINTTVGQYKQTYSVLPGDTISLAEFGKPLGLRIDSFTVDFADQYPEQYLTRVTVVEKGNELKEAAIAVNHPLSWKGIKTYQIGYGWVIKGELASKDRSRPVSIAAGELLELSRQPYLALKLDFFPDYHQSATGAFNASEYPHKPRAAFYAYSGTNSLDSGVLAPGQSVNIQGFRFHFIGYQRYTVLQSKVDPGIPWVYSGFAMLISGMILRYKLKW